MGLRHHIGYDHLNWLNIMYQPNALTAGKGHFRNVTLGIFHWRETAQIINGHFLTQK